MNISGSGHIPAGEYNENISISGSGKINGNLRCLSISCSGSIKGEGNVFCNGDFKCSGSTHLEKELHAKNITVSGSLRVAENIFCENNVRVSGGMVCKGKLKSGSVSCAGSIEISGDMEAEDFKSAGKLICGGLLNAEKINISLDGAGGRVGSIGGSEIRIYWDPKNPRSKKLGRMTLFSRLVNEGAQGCFIVEEQIEGDMMAIECVKAPKVVGRVVAIGEGCEIDLVQYSEEIEIHPDAKVGKIEKI